MATFIGLIMNSKCQQTLIESEKDYPSTWAAITAIDPKSVVLLKHCVFGIKNI